MLDNKAATLVDPPLQLLQMLAEVGFRGRGKVAPVEAHSWTITVDD